MPSIHYSPLPTPQEVEKNLPLSSPNKEKIQNFRSTAVNILEKRDPRIALLVGPCSIHSIEEAIEYGKRLIQLQSQIEDTFFLCMRVFLEKPRTRLGWKGFMYDPYLDGSNDVEAGIYASRRLLLHLAELGVPSATEFLEPIASPYIEDLVSWGVIGARTAASQPHRQLASGLPMPVGFKNGIYGELDVPISGIISARMPHAHFSIDHQGKVACARTTGNPWTHIVLRGAEQGPNYEPNSLQKILRLLREHHLEERLVIDCAHGNSQKNIHKQQEAFDCCIHQIAEGNQSIVGLMIESHLYAGKQQLCEEPDNLQFGISITDPCLGWAQTEQMIIQASLLLKRCIGIESN